MSPLCLQWSVTHKKNRTEASWKELQKRAFPAFSYFSNKNTYFDKIAIAGTHMSGHTGKTLARAIRMLQQHCCSNATDVSFLPSTYSAFSCTGRRSAALTKHALATSTSPGLSSPFGLTLSQKCLTVPTIPLDQTVGQAGTQPTKLTATVAPTATTEPDVTILTLVALQFQQSQLQQLTIHTDPRICRAEALPLHLPMIHIVPVAHPLADTSRAVHRLLLRMIPTDQALTDLPPVQAPMTPIVLHSDHLRGIHMTPIVQLHGNHRVEVRTIPTVREVVKSCDLPKTTTALMRRTDLRQIQLASMHASWKGMQG